MIEQEPNSGCLLAASILFFGFIAVGILLGLVMFFYVVQLRY